MYDSEAVSNAGGGGGSSGGAEGGRSMAVAAFDSNGCGGYG